MSGLPEGVIIGLDIGTVRTGVARAHTIARIASPLAIIDMADDFIGQLQAIIASEGAVALVAGLPRNMSGDDTAQTAFVRETVEGIEASVALPVYFVDEALTSEKAETELKARKKPYAKGDIDMLAACYILEDALEGNYHAAAL